GVCARTDHALGAHRKAHAAARERSCGLRSRQAACGDRAGAHAAAVRGRAVRGLVRPSRRRARRGRAQSAPLARHLHELLRAGDRQGGRRGARSGGLLRRAPPWSTLLRTAALRLRDAEARPEIRAGVELVGLEPSCLDVFRDELLNMLPHDEDAKRLAKQSFSFVEFLTERLDWQPPSLAATCVVQGHCHHRAAERTMKHDRELLDRLGVDYEILDEGCCGMAGSFGYHAGEHYEVSVAVAEHGLLPKLAESGESTVVVADGFSCRGQIEQLADRPAVHVAQLVQRALREAGRTGPEALAAPEPAKRGRVPVAAFAVPAAV